MDPMRHQTSHFVSCSYEDLVSAGGEKAAKEAGKLRVEGKEYVVQEADVMLFRTSA